ncbi:FkbM family methyltransferase [Ancylobacter radicis]|uniref:FkbM family methyltransferase n=1 Tax=Ancylobacter radicis TaxID=2836179 RepID=A0ABS5R4Z7_9HYPH|nr:FkbM family methyltransferase [Ancylobacter radicis]MBS9476724.1 FkbM family methyltransferase [Ancylobacter radicis]
MNIEAVQGAFGVFEIFGHDAGIRLKLKEYGAYQGSNLAMLMDALGPGDHVLDLGAHVGTFAIPLATRVGPTGRLVAVEGTAETHALLSRNMEANGVSWASALHRVVSATPGFYAVNFGGEDRMYNTGAARHEPAAQGVASISFEELVERHLDGRLDAIKIDVEGMDYAVLSAGADLIRDSLPTVAFEATLTPARAAEYDALFGSNFAFYENLEFRNGCIDGYLAHPLETLAGTYARGQHNLFAVARGSAIHRRWQEQMEDEQEALLRTALHLRRRGDEAASDELVMDRLDGGTALRAIVRAEVLSRYHRNDEAAATAGRAVEMAPSDCEILYRAARVHHRVGDRGAWLELTGLAAQANPRSSSAVLAHARALQADRRRDEAAQVIGGYLERFGDHPQALMAEARLRERADPRQAIEIARRATRIRPTDVGLRLALVDMLKAAGERRAAIDELVAMSRANRHHPKIRQALDDLRAAN